MPIAGNTITEYLQLITSTQSTPNLKTHKLELWRLFFTFYSSVWKLYSQPLLTQKKYFYWIQTLYDSPSYKP